MSEAQTQIPEETSTKEVAKEDLTEKWSDFLDEGPDEEDAVFDELETPAPEETKAPEAEAAEKEEEVEAGKEPEPEPKVVEEEEPEATTEEPSAVEQPEKEVVEEPPVEEPKPLERTPEELAALRTQAQDELRKSYELSADEVESMVSEPEKVLPDLAARVHMQVYEQVMQGLVAQMPRMVKGLLDQDRQVRSDEDAFYGRWPQLKDHRQQVGQVATLWRQLNPQATTVEAVEGIGKHAMIALGYNVGGATPAESSKDEVPSAPPAPAPVASVAPPAPAPRKNQFEILADEFLTEEDT